MKTISAPLNPEAMKRLDLDKCLPGDLEEFQISEEQYVQLSQSGEKHTKLNSIEKIIYLNRLALHNKTGLFFYF
ncbi:hypothetical protein [Pseudomonas sp. LB3P25]